MKTPITVSIRNNNGSLKWTIVIIEHEGQFFIEELSRNSLFSNPLAIGDTPGQALDNFLKIETELIESL